MINIIYKVLTANDSEQQKDDDNNDNVTKYLESNKDNILDLAEKHYEHLVQALANNAIGLTDAASSIPELSLSSSSSSTFLAQSNQSGTYRIEGPDTHHNSKDDVAE